MRANKKKKILDWYSSNFSCMFFACKYVSEDVSENCLCCNNVNVTSLFSDAARIPLSFARNHRFWCIVIARISSILGGENNNLNNNLKRKK